MKFRDLDYKFIREILDTSRRERAEMGVVIYPILRMLSATLSNSHSIDEALYLSYSQQRAATPI